MAGVCGGRRPIKTKGIAPIWTLWWWRNGLGGGFTRNMAPHSSELLGSRGLDVTGMGWALPEKWGSTGPPVGDIEVSAWWTSGPP